MRLKLIFLIQHEVDRKSKKAVAEANFYSTLEAGLSIGTNYTF
jgi:hypothetical protein